MVRLIRRHAPILIGVALILAFLVGSAFAAMLDRDEAVDTAQRTAAPLAALCDADPAAAAQAGADCAQARELARDGIDGRPGVAGRGVLFTQLDARGHLIVAYDDATSQDVGLVVGRDGTDGAEGPGIVSSSVEAGRLLVTYTDGRVADLGAVVGPAGVGVADLDGSTGRLLVTLTTGEVIDAGPLPSGPAGADGRNGVDGAPAPVVTAQRFVLDDGRVYDCTRSGGTDQEPTFDCVRQGGAEPGPTPDPPPPAEQGGGLPLIGG